MSYQTIQWNSRKKTVGTSDSDRKVRILLQRNKISLSDRAMYSRNLRKFFKEVPVAPPD